MHIVTAHDIRYPEQSVRFDFCVSFLFVVVDVLLEVGVVQTESVGFRDRIPDQRAQTLKSTCNIVRRHTRSVGKIGDTERCLLVE